MSDYSDIWSWLTVAGIIALIAIIIHGASGGFGDNKYKEIVFEDGHVDYCKFSLGGYCGMTYSECKSNKTYQCVVNAYTTGRKIT